MSKTPSSSSCTTDHPSPLGFFNRCLKIKDFLVELFVQFDRRFDGGMSFFFRHWGKTRFMMAMSKRLQMHGVERVFLKSRKAFFYFFMFYLIRDSILYIIIPIYFARGTGN